MFLKLKRLNQSNKFGTGAWTAPSGGTILWYNVNSLNPSRVIGVLRSSEFYHKPPKASPQIHRMSPVVCLFLTTETARHSFFFIISVIFPPWNSDVTFPRAACDQTRLGAAAVERQRPFKKAGQSPRGLRALCWLGPWIIQLAVPPDLDIAGRRAGWETMRPRPWCHRRRS